MKKIKFICLVMALAFVLMGAAYAAWTENINISGSVATGNYDVTFLTVSTNDGGTTVDPGFDRNVGKTEATLSADSKTINVTASNAYPGYNAIVTYKIKNTGSIPIKVTGVDINAPTELTVTNETSDLVGKILDPDQEFEAKVKHQVKDLEGNQGENGSYSYTVTVKTAQWNQ